jgi:alpha-tubulin suppressor-like RCC1 family protein
VAFLRSLSSCRALRAFRVFGFRLVLAALGGLAAVSAQSQPYSSISVGDYHVCAVRTNGGVQCWGDNTYGQLGNGTTSASATPVDVIGISTATAVTTGLNFSCALLQGGQARCWGDNRDLQLGGSPDSASSTPVVPNGNNLYLAIAAGNSHVCGVLLTGSYSCWGNNLSGQVGYGSGGNFLGTPVTGYPALVTNAVAVAAGAAHTCVLLATNEVSCWGANVAGQLGRNSVSAFEAVPMAVPNLTNATGLDLGGNHSCVRITIGRALCWGSNVSGQLGVNPSIASNSTFPTPMQSLILAGANVASVATGANHSCALLADQTVRCWGNNASGQLGDGTRTNSFNAVTVTGLTGVQSLSAGGLATCAITNAGAAVCWGDTDQGSSGSSPPVTVFGLNAATGVAAGGESSCALIAGTVKCWGSNYYGSLGNGSFADSATPVLVAGISNATALSGGTAHYCARLATGVVQCWGFNYYDSLGHVGQVGDSAVPLNVTNITTAVAVSAGWGHSCAVLQNQSVQCWGDGASGQLGANPPSGTSSATPLTVAGINTATGIAAGGVFSCALLSGGGVKCWGSNTFSQLGNGTVNVGGITPVTVAGVSTATAITAGGFHACALRANQTVWCWGANQVGQVGGGAVGQYWAGAQVLGITDAIAIAAGGDHTCAVLSTGAVRCWGSGGAGELGNNGSGYSATPVTVLGVTNATHIASGYQHSCARLATGSVVCWGLSRNGRLGDGSGQVSRLTPQYISSGKCTMDLDGDGAVTATGDGLMLMRALLGFSGGAVTTNAAAASGTRRTWGEIRAHLKTSCGVQGLAP